MANSADLRVRISADLADIKQGLGLLRGELAKVKQQASQTAPDTSKWSAGISNLRREIGNLAGAYVGLKSIGAVVRGVFDAFDRMDRIEEVTHMVSLSAEEVSKWAYAAQFAGVELETLKSGFFKFESGLRENQKLLQDLGVTAPTTNGKLLQLADVFQKLGDSEAKAELARKLFGKGAADLLPVLDQGRAGLEALGMEAERTGNVFSQQGVEGAAAFNDSLDTLKSQLRSVFTVAAKELAPAMTAYAGTASKAASESDAAAETGKFLANVFKLVAVGAVFVKNAVEAVVNVLGFLADVAIGTGKTVLGALGGAFTTIGNSMKAFFTGGPLAAFQTFTDGVKKNGAALLTASKDNARQIKAGWAAMKDGVGSAASDVSRAWGAAYGDVSKSAAGAGKAQQDAAKGAVAAGSEQADIEAKLNRLLGEKGDKADKAKKAVRGVIDENALLQDALKRSIDELDARFERGEIGVPAYYTAKRDLMLQAVDARIAEAQAEAKAATSTDQQSRALTEVVKLQRERAAIGPQVALDQAKAEKELTDQLELLRGKLADLQGGFGNEAAARLKDEYEALLKKLGDSAEGKDLAGKIFNIESAKARIDAIQSKAQEVINNLRSGTDYINSQQQLGGLGPGEAERQLQALRATSIEQLRQYKSEAEAALGSYAAGTPQHAAALQGLAQINTALADAEAAQHRFRNAVAGQATSALGGFFNDLIDGAKSFKEAFTDMVRNFLIGVAKMIAQELALRAIQAALRAFGGGSANGNVFSSGGMQQFAKGAAFALPGIMAFANGGAFTNQLITSPTLFAFGSGGQFGVMGEKGPEAVMPLERGSDGRLGVTAHGGGGSRRKPDTYVLAVGDDQIANAMAGADGEGVVLMHVRNNWGALNGGS